MSTLASVCIYDVYSNLPSAGIPGRMFYVSSGTNAGKVYRDNGSTWDQVATGGGGSPLTTKGDLYGFTTTDARIPIGTDGQVLTADSTAATGVSWQAGGGGSGALTLLASMTASNSSSLDFVGIITSSYDTYVVEFSSLLPVSGGNDLRLVFSTNGGSTYDTSSIYEYACSYSYPGGFGQGISSGSDTALQLIGSNWATGTMGGSGTLKIFDPLNGSLDTGIAYDTQYYHDGVSQTLHLNGGGRYRSPTAVNAFRLTANSGNLASGTVRVYGLSK